MIFAVGFGATGTKSLTWALDRLGFSTQHHCVGAPLQALIHRNFSALTQYDAHLDDPFGALWPILADVFPNARFIVTTRIGYHRGTQRNEYCVEHTTNNDKVSHCLMYGELCAMKDALPTTSAREQENVLALQQRFGKNVLVLNVSNHVESLTYKRLAGFLGVKAPEPEEPFPHTKLPGHFPYDCSKDIYVGGCPQGFKCGK